MNIESNNPRKIYLAVVVPRSFPSFVFRIGSIMPSKQVRGPEDGHLISDCLLAHAGQRQTTFRATRKEHELTFNKRSPDLILCSPLRRCLITCLRGFKQFPTIPILIMPELREVYHGCASKKQTMEWLTSNQDLLNYTAKKTRGAYPNSHQPHNFL